MMFSLRLGSVSSLRAERWPVLVSSRRHLALAVEGSPAGRAMPGSHMVTFSVNSKSQTLAVKASWSSSCRKLVCGISGCESGGCYHMTHTLSNCGACVAPVPLENMVNNFISKMEIHHF